ncbi:MAG: glutamate--cysteine ligase [Myxococcales bacterium]|nr:glutamate--cysteine ligase [Myxococcales bacterium]MCB9521169.1 glutamate--cysteine ligase [Myxococcales bacterium]MCB9530527.1 glutamate--cysteine ligase [Myxococcales bacterium]
MSRDQDPDHEPITGLDQLSQWFRDGSKGDALLGVGTEHEKPGFDAATSRPLSYEGPEGIGALLERIATRFGWEPTFDANGQITALLRDGAAVTLEPGGQLELSGRVTRTVFETRDELRAHLDEVAEIGAELGQVWTHLGNNPWDSPEQIPWMPKSRYGVMQRYLGQRGRFAHWMMKTTCTVQANYDYRDEADALRKLSVTSRLSPLVTALFAATPRRGGEDRGFVSSRMEIWEETDPDRTGTPLAYLDEDATFDDIVRWAIQVPTLFVVRDGRYVDIAGTRFSDLLDGRVPGVEPTMGDWALHLSTLFPDVRLKRYIEVRTADAGRPEQLLALPALWKGVLYDEQALALASDLVRVDHAGLVAAAAAAARVGYDATIGDATVGELAAALVRIAGDGLDRQAAVAGGPSERVFLAPLLSDDGRPVDLAAGFRAEWAAVSGERKPIIQSWRIDRGARG